MKRVTPQLKNITIMSGDFNPHPLWRGWLASTTDSVTASIFQSTPSVKRVTWGKTPKVYSVYKISIHTLCEEGDGAGIALKVVSAHFNPHPLWRGWQYPLLILDDLASISIHTLCEEGDQHHVRPPHARFIFQSTPSVKRVTRNYVTFWRSRL